MTDQEEEGRSTPPPVKVNVADNVGSSDAFQADAFQTAPSSPATPSQPATPSADVTSGDQTVTPHSGSLIVEGRKPTPEGTAYKLDLEGTSYGLKGSDLEGVLKPPVPRSAAALRPVEVMLRDPLGEVARKERRSLLGISAIAILVGWTGLVPAKIENFGITFSAPERKALLWVSVAVVLYYTVAFIVYALSDFLSYLYAVHQGRVTLRKQRESEPLPPTSSERVMPPSIDTPWSFVGYVTPASLARGVFDFLIPLAVAGVAIWSLWSAVHQVAAIAPSAPAMPAVAPSAPQDTAPSLKAAPPVKK